MILPKSTVLHHMFLLWDFKCASKLKHCQITGELHVLGLPVNYFTMES